MQSAIIFVFIYVDPRSGNGVSGLSLTQLLVYAQHYKCPEVIDGEIVQLLLNNMCLDVHVIYFL